jgi:dGTP triphosphohydrolase
MTELIRKMKTKTKRRGTRLQEKKVPVKRLFDAGKKSERAVADYENDRKQILNLTLDTINATVKDPAENLRQKQEAYKKIVVDNIFIKPEDIDMDDLDTKNFQDGGIAVRGTGAQVKKTKFKGVF